MTHSFPEQDVRPAEKNFQFATTEQSGDGWLQTARRDAYSGSSDIVEIPLLRLSEQADKNHTELLPSDAPHARQYLRARESVVRISGPSSQEKDYTNYGSGFFVSRDGKIATDYHVVKNIAGPIRIDTADGSTYYASLEKTRPTVDIAILKVEPHYPGQSFPALPLAPTAGHMQPGERLYTLGHPHGWRNLFLSVGDFAGFQSFSAVPETHEDSLTGKLLAKQLPVNPELPVIAARHHVEQGNSGGPVMSSEGKVIGLVETTDIPTDGSAPRTGKVTPVDELHQLLGTRPNAPLRDYFIPKAVNIDEDTIGYGAMMLPLASFARLRPGKLAAGASAIVAFNGALTTAMNTPYFFEAMRTGTTAEKVNAGIDMAADGMMLSGFVGLFAPRWRAATATLQVLGSSTRLVNNLMSNRRY